MATQLLDTSILIDALRGHQPAIAWLNTLTPDDCAISFITIAELLTGARNRRDQQRLLRMLSEYVVQGLKVQRPYR